MKSFEVVNQIPAGLSRMPQESQLLLKALIGLENGTGLRFRCKDYNEAFRTSKVLLRFIYDAIKSKKISERFSVRRRKEQHPEKDIWYVYVVRKEQ